MEKSITDAICVYGASSSRIDPIYKEAARLTGQLIAVAGCPLVCGGGSGGLMAEAIEGANSKGGLTIGVLPEFMVERQWQHPALGRMISTPDMHRRKHTMASMSRAVIALPGGVGTLEELLEIITWRQLGLYDGNVTILNTDGYYDPLITMLERTIEKRFMRQGSHNLWQVASTPEEAVEKSLSEA